VIFALCAGGGGPSDSEALNDDPLSREWDAASGFPIIEFLRYRANVFMLVWLPDSHRLLTGSAGGTMRHWYVPEPARPLSLSSRCRCRQRPISPVLR
jgi:WD40 repeat protein